MRRFRWVALCAVALFLAAAPAAWGQPAEDLWNRARAAASPDERIRLYAEYLRLRPDSFAAYNNRGNAYKRKELHDQAVADYTKAIQLKPDYALAHYNCCVAYGRKKLLDQAVADCAKAWELARRQGTPPDRLKSFERRLIRYQKLKAGQGK